MSSPGNHERRDGTISEKRERFQQRIEELVSQIERDVDRSEWITRRYPKRLRDENREVYEVPALYLQKGLTRLLLDPIAYDVPGAEGVADLYLMPAYEPTISVYFEAGRWLLHDNDQAQVMSDSSLSDSQGLPLSPETINQALNSIADNAVPSV